MPVHQSAVEGFAFVDVSKLCEALDGVPHMLRLLRAAEGQQEPLTVFSRLPQHLRFRPLEGKRAAGDAIVPIQTVMLRRNEFS